MYVFIIRYFISIIIKYKINIINSFSVFLLNKRTLIFKVMNFYIASCIGHALVALVYWLVCCHAYLFIDCFNKLTRAISAPRFTTL